MTCAISPASQGPLLAGIWSQEQELGIEPSLSDVGDYHLFPLLLN